ncbi:mechanosensitive ion channel family protein [Adonisia turfae]|uniref:Mechanosensitive ion channel family protein n=1 Tax=Adonisia turfae CCMR0081 TaxID=2292702 RepID=A0A6M0RKG3_9CYAN|nr:mechanosensitive ion channel domain-containing protein [Adonisia turfae]NEZ56748.1 mechanosensitive ion channel family protein [Adonisia turfae CCMR0081]
MNALGQISSAQSNQLLTQVRNISVDIGLQIIVAIIILIVGRWMASFVKQLIKKLMAKARIEPTLISFASNILYYGTLAFFILAALGQLGIETTSLVAVLGAAGLAIGLALQGSLSNFAAGILIILFQPFRVGDWIEAADINGIVEEIQVFTVILRTLDNRTVIVPNSKLTDNNIINYSAKGILRVDLVIGVAYQENLAKVKQLTLEVLAGQDLVLAEPKPTVGVLELADSSVNLAVRPWTKTENYWNVYFGVQESLKTRFDEVGISIPFPQREVHLIGRNNGNNS